MNKEDCPFCQIAQGEMESEILYQEDSLVAFEDLEPQTPTHVLVVPKENVTSLPEVPAQTLKQIMDATHTIAEQQGITEGGYAIRVNYGENAGQMVEHLHVHVMGGRELGMP